MRTYGGNWFWSYQCDAQEKPEKSLAPVVFYDHYDPFDEVVNSDDCPLNSAADITGTCGKCRRCFDGTAVARAKELLPVLNRHIDA
jgi:phage terminase large subunit GpA-like protein